MREESPRLPLGIIILALVVASVAFIAAMPWAFSTVEQGRISMLDYVLVVGGLLLSLGFASATVRRLFIQHSQALHDISWEEADEMFGRLQFYDLPPIPPLRPALRVQEGRAHPDAPSVLLKAGGPGYLSVAHDNAVVTQRLGRLNRSLGPGFHRLQPFEKVWDVVDLRRQRRKLSVDFMTRDGIPASCEASIVFRIAPSQQAEDTNGYAFEENNVLKVTTGKYVRSLEGSDRVSDWTIGLANGALDGVVRDLLEQYRLDEFLNPQYWDMLQAAAQQSAGIVSAGSTIRPKTLAELEAQIASQMREIGKERGILVERVELGPIMPAEETISREWLTFWQDKLQREIDSFNMSAEAKKAQLEEDARIEAEVSLINGMLTEVQRLSSDEMGIPPELILMCFMDVLHSMAGRSSLVQQSMFRQAESLLHIIQKVLPSAPSPRSTQPELPPADEDDLQDDA